MCYVSSPCCLVECLACIPIRSFHLELQPNANSLQAALCSGFAHHPLFPEELTHLSGIGTWK